MKALSKLKPEPGIWMVDAGVPAVGNNDVLIKVTKTAICGTDLHIYKWDDWAASTIPVPMITGHEFVGEVVAIGSEVTGINKGDRVSGEGHIVCGHCRNCKAGKRHLCRGTIGLGVHRQGAFAEYVAIPAVNVFKIPEGIADDLVSMFDPLGNAVHTALSFDLVGEDVLITGAGPIGIMALKIAKFVGCKRVVITDINEYRLQMARQAGADVALNIAAYGSDEKLDAGLHQLMQEIGMTEGFDVGLEMSGHPGAIATMIRMLNNGGKMALLGIAGASITLPWNDIIFKGLTLKGIYGREMFETWYKMASMVQSGLDVADVITHHYSVDNYQQAFEVMQSGQCGKVILDWGS